MVMLGTLGTGVAKSLTSISKISVKMHTGEKCRPKEGCLLLFSTKLSPAFCDPIDHSMPSYPVLHCLTEFAKIHVH